MMDDGQSLIYNLVVFLFEIVFIKMGVVCFRLCFQVGFEFAVFGDYFVFSQEVQFTESKHILIV